MWFYDLHPTVREHLSQDGDIPLLLAHHLRTRSRRYTDAAELELLDGNGSSLAEADLVALSDGDLITAEAKRPGSLGEGREARRAAAKRVLIAEQLVADQILMATAAEHWQQASIDGMCQAVRDHRWQVVKPRLRLVTGLGGGLVVDQEVDPGTRDIRPWQ